MNTKKPRTPALNLTRLSQVAQILVDSPTQVPDQFVAVEKIKTQKQVRKQFKDLEQLAESIKSEGIIQPLLVTDGVDGNYLLVAGERRYRAAIMAGLMEVPIIVKKGLTEKKFRTLQVLENVERDNLTLAEEIAGVADDVSKWGNSETAKIWNRSPAWISKRLSAAKFEAPVLSLMTGELCGDIDTLHSLNQLYKLDERKFSVFFDALQEGRVVTREQVANQVKIRKEAAGALKDVAKLGESHLQQAAKNAENEMPQDSKPGEEKPPHVVRAPAQEIAAPSPAAQPRDKLIRSIGQELCDEIEGNAKAASRLNAKLDGGVLTEDEQSWLQWCCFSGLAAAVLKELSPAQAIAMANTFAREIKTNGAAGLLDLVAPKNGGAHEMPTSPPDGWTL